jgi:hypothetical protein
MQKLLKRTVLGADLKLESWLADGKSIKHYGYRSRRDPDFDSDSYEYRSSAKILTTILVAMPPSLRRFS